MSFKWLVNAGKKSTCQMPSTWLILTLMVVQIREVMCWSPSTLLPFASVERFGHRKLARLQSTDTTISSLMSTNAPAIALDAIAYSGLQENEFEVIRTMVERAYLEVEGIGIAVLCNTSGLQRQEEPCKSPAVIGALGRVLLLRTNLDEESIETIEYTISALMDGLLYSDPPLLMQPILVKLQNPNNFENSNSHNQDVLQAIIEQEASMYDLNTPIWNEKIMAGNQMVSLDACPVIHVELDAAEVTDSSSSTTWWDTSTILVFDGLVDDDLRKRLLKVVLGPTAENWNDVQDGPDPKRWIRGGLMDVTGDEDEPSPHNDEEKPCWGLTEDAINEICFQSHDAIQEFETILSQKVFPQFIVSRLPEAVFGACVSPLTANAPTHGDSFDFHIDGDPNMLPPSPWTDVYGRYPNRLRGKPRFMSCLVYVNDEWDEHEWGAPTRFLDLPTNLSYDVSPRPGRCVIMDQDISHTVVGPNSSAGNRPRYSMVWKVILHPKIDRQDMTDLSMGRNWPESLFVGSAKIE